MHPFQEFINPHLGKLLAQLNIDKQFARGEGCYLFDAGGTRYLDFVAAYGALPFGHNPPEIWQAIQRVQACSEPGFSQPSALDAAGELARALVAVAPAGMQYVTFTNSGTEAVEAAIKLCRAATGRMGILTTDNSFHGKTLGALSATGRTSYQKAFGAPVPGFERVPFGDLAALSLAFATAVERRGDQYAAFMVEPIQGEGGIVVTPPGYLAEVRRLCDEHGVLLVFDEIQSGLGRTGQLFACMDEGVTPDVMTLAKALGGGLVPIGACLSTAAAYTEEFGMKHSSTFAGGTLACRVGLAALELLTRDGGRLMQQVAENGAYLKDGLRKLQIRYPHLIRAVRGRGYMLGIDIGLTRDTFPDSFLGVMAEQESLTPVITSYLLNVERLRVAPTLNGATVIRIEPPLIATRAECDFALAALDRMFTVLAHGCTAEFLRHLVDVPARPRVPVTRRSPLATRPLGTADEGRFAFLVHPVDLRNYAEFDESMATFTDDEMRRLVARWNDSVQPFVISQTRVTGASGRKAYGEFIVVQRTADELLNMPHGQAVAEVGAAAELALQRGARIVGLGAYTSVVTRGGTHLRHVGVPLTTGNSYTVVAAVDSVYQAVSRQGLPLARAAVAMVGATGAIGRGVCILLAEELSRLILIGNPARPDQSRRRLLRIGGEICRHLVRQVRSGQRFRSDTLGDQLSALQPWPAGDAPVEEYVVLAQKLEQHGGLTISTDLDGALPLADIIVTATSSTGELVTPANVKFGAAVCDLSRPPNVSREMREHRPDVLVIDGGVIAVPGLPDLGWNFGFERGLAYACMAETMMLALDHHYEDTSLGADLTLETILHVRSLADQHGFRLAQLRSFDRPLTESDWQRILEARAAMVR